MTELTASLAGPSETVTDFVIAGVVRGDLTTAPLTGERGVPFGRGNMRLAGTLAGPNTDRAGR